MDNEGLLVTYAETGSPEALDELVRRNQNLLHHILKRFAYASEPYEDLLQVANLVEVWYTTADRKLDRSIEREFDLAFAFHSFGCWP